MDERKTGSFHLTGAGQSGGSTDDAVAIDFPLPEMPRTSGWPAYRAKFNWADMRAYARAAVLADRELRSGEFRLPAILKVLAEWEDVNGTICGIMPDEWMALMEPIANVAIFESPRMARTRFAALAEPTRAGTERHTRNEPDPESGISPGSSIPVERGMV